MSAPAVPRRLDDWLVHLESLHPRGQAGIELGLERVQTVSRALSQTRTCPVITVAGTNGKGSTCAFLEHILRAAGYRVGVYSSPHLLRFNERVRLNGQEAADEAFCAALARVEAMRRAVPLTYFEFATLAAWEVFAAAKLDVIILEVGLGGRLDATNIYDPDVALMTSIALDHTEYLGNTREAIGYEKAGIARPGRPLVCGDVAPPASVLETCRRVGADFLGIGRDFGYIRQDGQWQYWRHAHGQMGGRKLGGLAYPALRGDCQLANASCAITALDYLHAEVPVSAQDIRLGLATVDLPGRCQVLPGRPQIVLDVAHNPQAAAILADSLGCMGFARKTWAIFGMMADKDIDAVIAAVRHRVDVWLPCDLPGVRAASAANLQARLEKVGAGGTAGTFPTPAAALHYAQEQARLNENGDDRILAFGSFLTVAGVMQALGRRA
jgi:dihydrofolate synthase/folylpolyglutamate synthase